MRDQSAANARARSLLASSQDATRRLAFADQAYQKGDVRVASNIYLKLALRRNSPGADQARNRLVQLQDDGLAKLREIDTRLADQDIDAPEIVAAFQQYGEVVDHYRRVPGLRNRLRSHVSKQRRDSRFAAVLNEPEAKTLFDLGKSQEAEGNSCCAYWAYQDAAGLAPASSAQQALARLQQMDRDPRIVEAAETCRQLQRCHELYTLAGPLVRLRPSKAEEYYQRVVELAPEDSPVHSAALERLRELRR